MNALFNYYLKNNYFIKKYENNIRLISSLDRNNIIELYNRKFLFVFKKAIHQSFFYSLHQLIFE